RSRWQAGREECRQPDRMAAGAGFCRQGIWRRRHHREGICQGGLTPASWPGLSRPSTSLVAAEKEDVDARVEPGHDEERGTGLMVRDARRAALLTMRVDSDRCIPSW